MSKKHVEDFREPISIAGIQSGDLLAWKKDSQSVISDTLVQGIRAMTKSRYGHVGIAWRCHDGLDDELFVIEATFPKIRAARLCISNDFHCVPMGLQWTPPGKGFLIDKIGKSYSIADAARAFYGIQLKDDDEYQCVELAHYFYEKYGIVLQHDFTPGGIVKAAELHTKTKAMRVVH